MSIVQGELREESDVGHGGSEEEVVVGA